MDEEEFHEVYLRGIKIDLDNINAAMDGLIDSVSRFKSVTTTEDLSNQDFADMLLALDHARFIIAGVMYLHGKHPCGHSHDEEEYEDEE